ncbi:MAG: NAD(P)/FAD-dependent oxidoreductase [Candidatus Latescibacterota bacterium]
MNNETEAGPDKEKTYDIIIIGGGPAGLSAALYTARGELSTLVIDKNPAAGALGYARIIENYPGVSRAVKGLELLGILREQAGRFGATIIQAPVIGVNFEQEIREVITVQGSFFSRTVIIATGSMGRNPGIPGEAEYIGRGVSYCAVCDAAFFRDAEVAAVGNIELMLEELDYLLKIVHRVTIITSAEELAPDLLQELAGNPRISLMLGHRPAEIFGGDTVSGIRVVSSRYGENDIMVSGVFLYLQGQQPVVDYLYGALPLEEGGCIKVNREDMSTPISGVFAAGDVTCKRIRQAIIAAAEGCNAALSAERFITERKHIRYHWH